jgi:hypothetical protein
MGRKPSTGTKIFGIVRFWARIVDGCFILYSPKGRIKRRSREEFKDVEHCRVRLRDAVVALNTSTSRRKKPTLTLTDKNATVYQLQTPSAEEAKQWVDRIQSAINSFKPALNLINFDEEVSNGHTTNVM